jgi:hypothetical protein
MKRLALLILSIGLVVVASAQQTAEQYTQVRHLAIGGFPYYGAAVTPSDTTSLSPPGYVRADAAGAVTAACNGNGIGNQITLNLAAGEFFPCLVVRVYDTNTDDINLHVFY